MAEIRAAAGMAKGGSTARMDAAVDAHIVLHPRIDFIGRLSFLGRSDFEDDRRDGRLSIADDDGWTQIFADVEAFVPVLREALAAWEARLVEIQARVAQEEVDERLRELGG